MTRVGAVLLAVLMSMPSLIGQAQSPTLDDTASRRMVRAAGMPLQDGALPPGVLTVRIVQGEFAADLEGRSVEIALNGGETRKALTGGAGRAEFAHIPVGSQVRVTAVVDGQRLQSEVFAMPPESGLRVLLVADGGVPGNAGRASLPPMSTSPTTQASGAIADESDDLVGGAPVRIIVMSITVLAFVLLGAQRWRGHRGR